MPPNALDADSVEQQILKLEYRIGQAQVKEDENRNESKQTSQIGGMWKNNYRNQKFQVVMHGDSFEVYQTGYCPLGDCNRGWKVTNSKEYTGTIGKNGEISGFYFVTAAFAEGLSRNQKEGVPCKVSEGWFPVKVYLSEQGSRMTIKSNIPQPFLWCYLNGVNSNPIGSKEF